MLDRGVPSAVRFLTVHLADGPQIARILAPVSVYLPARPRQFTTNGASPRRLGHGFAAARS
jgi:hypothetical protein